MKILLDTNFILSCVKQKIDFFSLAEEMFDEKLEWVVPKEVLEELKDLTERKKEKVADKQAADLSLQILERAGSERIELRNKNVDKGIIDYLKKHPDFVLATLDKKLKLYAGVRILTIRNKKSLEIV